MKKMKLAYIAVAGAVALTSCNDFLDKMPDNRVDPQTPDQLLSMMVDGYSLANYAKLCEFSGDNIIDNNSPDENGVRYNLTPYDNNRIDDELFAWEDAESDMDTDSPSFVWEQCYHSIAVDNHVLEKIAEFEQTGKVNTFSQTDLDKMNAARGEALVSRAYHHFVLVNLFAQNYRGAELSKDLVGIPYVTVPETTVHVDYARESVADVYDKIEADLLEGLKYIDDTYYEQPKYHFNKAAAFAFAARFYLFKRDYPKVDYYATQALGASPASMMRTYWSVNYSNEDSQIMDYVSSTSQSNLLLMPTNSAFWRAIAAESRYALNRDAAKATIYGPGPTWSSYNFHPCYNGKLYINGKEEYGMYFMKVGELFEYTDKVAGIGYVHVVRAEFTAEETLLTRAEARIYLAAAGKPTAVADANGDLTTEGGRVYTMEDAVDDLRIWEEARRNLPAHYEFRETLTSGLIQSWYGQDRGYGIVKTLEELPINEICKSDDYPLTQDMLPYINCLLHFRRIETVFDGLRWFDIKRYGIEVTHKIGRTRVETLTKLDPRRALQIPVEVISAGMEANDRNLPLVDGQTGVKAIPFTGKLIKYNK